jgi:hypothetical protein
MGAVLQPMPTVQVETDAAGNIKFSGAALSRQQWQAMAKASGWTDGAQGQGLVQPKPWITSTLETVLVRFRLSSLLTFHIACPHPAVSFPA